MTAPSTGHAAVGRADSERPFAVRARLVQDATCSLPQTLRSLHHLVGVATARFETQCELMRDTGQDLALFKAQLDEFVRRAALGEHDALFLTRLGVILGQQAARLQGAAA
jgi:hypothetical protein